ncbi:MAG: choice-of-anchor tandem repeat GloVer-containing protein [Candidatus Cybelea sp.]
MRRWNLSHYAINSCVIAALLAGCGGSQPPIGATPGSAGAPAHSIVHPSTGSSYRVIHRFVRPDRGLHPRASVIAVNGWLYGTTSAGGTRRSPFCERSCGSVYRMDPASGTIKALHLFGQDGYDVQSGLIDVNGMLYGTTNLGGDMNCGDGCGTVFSISKRGAETTLYGFNGGNADGAYPSAGLVNVDGTLYGTTEQGGLGASGSLGCENGCGTIYSITTSGSEKVLYKFMGSQGFYPVAGLIDVKGTLYGTASLGGKKGKPKCSFGFGCGMVYSISTTGILNVLHQFTAGSDGANPATGLVDVNGTLYGTTNEGGGSGCGGSGCGTVYSVRPGGAEKVLYRFSGGSDGSDPDAALVEVGGVLYGTTANGGGSGCAGSGCGTVYSISTTGAETVLHSFGGSPDGATPVAALINVRGVLYGTTFYGGDGSGSGGYVGRGTVFTLTP